MKKTARAPANIAFIKYWGKKDAQLRIPLNDSISMNLSAAYSETTVEFSKNYPKDDIVLKGGVFSAKERTRITAHLDRIRAKAGIHTYARVVTKNSFPKSAGIASSASGFAALTLAASASAGLPMSERELTILARLGSGSAARSIPDGFVRWKTAESPRQSYAYSLYPPDYWDMRDILVIVSSSDKEVSSTDAHAKAETSPRLPARLAAIPSRIARITDALARKDFTAFGEVLEEDCLDMHAVAQSQTPPLAYFTPTTRAILAAVTRLRREGIAAYATVDAGPNVHVICQGRDENVVKNKVQSASGVQRVLINKPALGARLVSAHLF